MFKRSLFAIAAAAVTAGAVALAAPANAAPVEDAVTIAVGDLDLSNPADVVRFDRRVQSAARSICGTPQFQPLDLSRQVTACQAQIVANAKAEAQVALAGKAGAIRLALR